MRFVVTGTGRSGTRWASQVLGVGHQQMFTGEGFVDTGEKGDASFWAASQDLKGWRVVLLVRDPRYVVASWLNTGEFDRMLGNGYYRMWQHCNRLDPNILQFKGRERLIYYWWAVNVRMAQRADVVMRVEDATHEGLVNACDVDTWTEEPQPESSTKPSDIRCGDFPDGGRLAKEFGYDC